MSELLDTQTKGLEILKISEKENHIKLVTTHLIGGALDLPISRMV